MNPVAASSEARSGARTRSTSDAISVVTSRRSEGSVGRSDARIRSLPDGRLGDLELDRGHIVGVAHQRALVGGAAGRDREHGRGAVDQDQAGVERAGGGTQDRGQTGAVLDGIGDRGQRSQVGRGRPGLLRAGQPTGAAPLGVRTPWATRPRPRRRAPPRPPRTRRARRPTAPRRASRSCDAPVRGDRRNHHEQEEREQAEHSEACRDQVGDLLVAHGCRWNCARRGRCAVAPGVAVTYAAEPRTPAQPEWPRSPEGTVANQLGGRRARPLGPVFPPEQTRDRRPRAATPARRPRRPRPRPGARHPRVDRALPPRARGR